MPTQFHLLTLDTPPQPTSQPRLPHCRPSLGLKTPAQADDLRSGDSRQLSIEVKVEVGLEVD